MRILTMMTMLMMMTMIWTMMWTTMTIMSTMILTNCQQGWSLFTWSTYCHTYKVCFSAYRHHPDNHPDINHLDHGDNDDDDYDDQVTSTRHPGHILGAGRPGT